MEGFKSIGSDGALPEFHLDSAIYLLCNIGQAT